MKYDVLKLKKNALILRRHVHNWARGKSICDVVSMYMQTQLSQ